MTKRLLSFAFALIFALVAIPFSSVKSEAAKEGTYISSKALEYARKNWNNGVGLCADFVSKCLQAGDVDIYGDTVKKLYNSIKDTHGTSYKLKLTNGKSGKINMSDNSGKLKKGDPVFYKCNYCGDFEHVVLCNGANADGYCVDYAHNNAHNGKKTTYTYRHCGGESWTLYSVRMYEAPKLYGEKTDVGVPKISSAVNGADGVVLKWNSVKNADKYRVYRKTSDTAWKKLGTVESNLFTDKTAKNGVSYTYTVRAVDGDKTSRYYAGKKVKCLAAPSLSSVKNNASGVKISWRKVSSADGYCVYRKGNTGSWKQIANIKGDKSLTYTDTNVNCSEIYKYTVRAYDGKVRGCYNSGGIKTIFLTSPDGLTAESGETGIVLNFNEVNAAKAYDIYRKTDDCEWEKISSVAGRDTTSFVDIGVEDAETYRYSVRSVNGKYYSAFDSKGVSCRYDEV